MAEDGISNVPKRVTFCCLMQLVILVLGVIITFNMYEVASVARQNNATVTEIIDNWNVLPFTKIRVANNKCKDSEESVFVRKWGGSEEGCLVNKRTLLGFSTEQVVMTTNEYNRYIRSREDSHSSRNNDGVDVVDFVTGDSSARRYEPCMPISMKSAKYQDRFLEKRFCGTRGGPSFLTMQRPVKKGEDSDKADASWSCPKGQVACSSETAPDNTVCVKEGSNEADCPITTVKFVDEKMVAEY